MAESLVPAHMNDVEGGFCPGGEKMAEGGRCEKGCEHAEHYSNDGHPECEDAPIIPGPATPLERGASAMETTPEQWREGVERLSLEDLERRAVNSSLTDPTWRTDYR